MSQTYVSYICKLDCEAQLTSQKHYTKDSPDRHALQQALEAQNNAGPLKVPLVVAGEEVRYFHRALCLFGY